MGKYKLTYFNAKGVIEPARFIFAEAGVAYEDVRVEKEEWANMKAKCQCSPFCQLPTLEADGKCICQSHTICRYLATKFGLVSTDPYEQAQADMIAESIKDWFMSLAMLKYETDEAKKEESKHKLINEKMPGFFKAYEKLLGNNDYMVGNKCSWVDFLLAYNLTFTKLLKEDILNEYPNLANYIKRVHDRPKIKEWIAKRPQTEN